MRFHQQTAAAGAALLFVFTLCVRAAPGDLDASFTATADKEVLALATQPDGRIIIGGWFQTVNGVARSHLARLEPDGTLDASFHPVVNDVVFSVIVQPDGVLIGGTFNRVDGLERNGMARLRADGTLDPAFDPNAPAGVPLLTIQPDGRILAAGSFTSMGGVSRKYLARLLPGGALDTAFTPAVSAFPDALALQSDGKILLSGPGFVTRFLPDGTRDTTFTAAVFGAPEALLAQPDGKILTGGAFPGSSPTTFFLMQRLKADGTKDTAFTAPVAEEVCICNGGTLLQGNGHILFGASFSSIAGAPPRGGLARLMPDGTVDPAFVPVTACPVSYVSSVTYLPDGSVLAVAGNDCTQPGSYSIVRLSGDPVSESLTVPAAGTVRWTRSATAPEVSQVDISFSADSGQTWSDPQQAVRIPDGWEVTGLNLPAAGMLRARARIAGGFHNASMSLWETRRLFPGSALAAWRQEHFGTASNTGDAADGADPDGDGLSNFAEYAFGLDPLSAVSGQLPQPAVSGGDFVIDFPQPPGVSGVAYGAEWATDLTTGPWLPLTDTGTAPQHTFKVPVATHGRLFIRLKVTAN